MLLAKGFVKHKIYICIIVAILMDETLIYTSSCFKYCQINRRDAEFNQIEWQHYITKYYELYEDLNLQFSSLILILKMTLKILIYTNNTLPIFIRKT